MAQTEINVPVFMTVADFILFTRIMVIIGDDEEFWDNLGTSILYSM